MKNNKKLSLKGENILIFLSVMDLLIILYNKITFINILVLLLYIYKIILFIKYNQTFRNGGKNENKRHN